MRPSVGVASLVLITLIWGSTFVVIKDALETIPVSLLLAIRFTIATATLLWAKWDRRALVPALVLGVVSFVGYGTQTVGINITSASNAAFITGLAVIVTPALGAVIYKKRLAPRFYLAAAMAVVGLGFVTLRSGVGGVNAGDFWVLGTALANGFYVVYLGEVAGRVRGSSLALMQHVPLMLLSWAWAAPEAHLLPTVPVTTYLAIVYLAVVATSLVVILQTYAQRVVPAHVTALIFVLEPAFAAAFAYALLGERLGALGLTGGAILLLSMFIAEGRLPARPLPRGFGARAVRKARGPGDGREP